jgi:uncharacterized membrane protein YphA (DoxX/SURF4 family)
LKLGPWLAGGSLKGELARWALSQRFTFWRECLLGRAQTYAELIAHLVTYGEIVVGACLVIGLFTRAASALAAAGLLVYLLAAGSLATVAETGLSLVALVTLAAAGAGRVVGLDRRLFARAPVMPFTLLY